MVEPDITSDIASLREQIDQVLKERTRRYTEELCEIGEELDPVAAALNDFVEGGKRFRPIFGYLGYLATGTQPKRSVLVACSALELVHICALIHDDLMDGSDTRRKKPSIHRRFSQLHRDQSYQGDADRFGSAAAILLGDLALVWADRILTDSGIEADALFRTMPIFNLMRDELMAGQYLDVLEGALATTSVERSLKVARFKSGKYSIERPLHFGAALAGAQNRVLEELSKYGLPLGEAFQLRDDILGVFGNSSITGKPAGDDLREGKRTVMIAMTHARATKEQGEKLSGLFGKPDLNDDEVSTLRGIITETGALGECERLIETLASQSSDALKLSHFDSEAKKHLDEMIKLATKRDL